MKIEFEGYFIEPKHITRISKIIEYKADGVEGLHWHFTVYLSDGGHIIHTGYDKNEVAEKMAYYGHYIANGTR